MPPPPWGGGRGCCIVVQLASVLLKQCYIWRTSLKFFNRVVSWPSSSIISILVGSTGAYPYCCIHIWFRDRKYEILCLTYTLFTMCFLTADYPWMRWTWCTMLDECCWPMLHAHWFDAHTSNFLFIPTLYAHIREWQWPTIFSILLASLPILHSLVPTLWPTAGCVHAHNSPQHGEHKWQNASLCTTYLINTSHTQVERSRS